MRYLYCLLITLLLCTTSIQNSQADEITLAVSDPLALPLACACVDGFAQRDYEKLGKFLEKELGVSVKVVFNGSIDGAKRLAKGKLHLLVGKDSILRNDAKESKLPLRPIAALTNNEGVTTFHGLFVVPTEAQAKKIADLGLYAIYFGEDYSAVKYEAAIEALQKAGIKVPDVAKRKTIPTCTEAVFATQESTKPAVAVICNYALALLEGCKTIEPGSLRVVGKTGERPFIRVFATENVSSEMEKKVLAALKKVATLPELCKVMESKNGFVAIPEEKTSSNWPSWRGANRDGIVAELPNKLPATLKPTWSATLTLPSGTLGGVAVTDQKVVVGDRDALDQKDIFRCFDAVTGKELWTYEYIAPCELDYGNSPRATPLIADGAVFTLGAAGHLTKLNLADGKKLWQILLPSKFSAPSPAWGHCASPLLVDGKLIVLPGGKEASVVALSPSTGEVIWQTPGNQAAYSSPIVGEFGSKRQIVTYDIDSLGGWELSTGKRLWRLVPPETGDFNVPTPVRLENGNLLVMTENNGTRIYTFSKNGEIEPKPVAIYDNLAADSMTPVVAGGKVFGVSEGLVTLKSDDLTELSVLDDAAFDDYASLIADLTGKLLVTSSHGELLLYDVVGKTPQLLSRLQVTEDGTTLSHPSIVENSLYFCSPGKLLCIKLDE